MATVQIEDIEARWRLLSDPERPVATSLVVDATAILKSFGIDVDAADPDALRAVVCAAVLRVLRNPGGNRSESVDDFSFTRDDSTAAGALYFTDDELQMLRGRHAKARSIRFSNGR